MVNQHQWVIQLFAIFDLANVFGRSFFVAFLPLEERKCCFSPPGEVAFANSYFVEPLSVPLALVQKVSKKQAFPFSTPSREWCFVPTRNFSSTSITGTINTPSPNVNTFYHFSSILSKILKLLTHRKRTHLLSLVLPTSSIFFEEFSSQIKHPLLSFGVMYHFWRVFSWNQNNQQVARQLNTWLLLLHIESRSSHSLAVFFDLRISTLASCLELGNFPVLSRGLTRYFGRTVGLSEKVVSCLSGYPLAYLLLRHPEGTRSSYWGIQQFHDFDKIEGLWILAFNFLYSLN